ncbi:MAG: hypothetical protein CEE38_06435 [Planctomycetes bacterium B3_Pla]|nr:MAG: hypothetical protein CEE38_06435 [Planctomycetes bacterium B3_Pla]
MHRDCQAANFTAEDNTNAAGEIVRCRDEFRIGWAADYSMWQAQADNQESDQIVKQQTSCDTSIIGNRLY